MLTAQECIDAIKVGITKFGTYTYYDKGPDEIIDVAVLKAKARQMQAKDLATVLLELDKYEHGNLLARAIVSDCDDMPEDWWNELMDADPSIAEMY